MYYNVGGRRFVSVHQLGIKMNKTCNCSPCACDAPSSMKSKERQQREAVYYFLLGYDFHEMLGACDGSSESIDGIVEEALKYNTGEKLLTGIDPHFKFKVEPRQFREAVICVLNHYWGHEIPITISSCCGLD